MNRPRTLHGAPGLLIRFLLASSLAGCGPATRDAVRACTVDPDCGQGVRCVEGACQASTPPVADFSLPAELRTHRLVRIAGLVSDPDAGDTVSSWAWAVTRLTAACDADVDVADTAELQAVFWCPGTYEVALTVTDGAGAVSAPVRRTTTVSTLAGAPSVSAGPPLAVEHRCAGAPLRCELERPIRLTAAGQAPLGGPLTYRWTALPPDPSRAAAAATFDQAAESGDATFRLATEGGPISGAWRLRVRAEDALGSLAQAFQLVTVGNREPVVDATAVSLDHRYDGAYRIDGPLAVPVSDPDGDPVELALVIREPAATGCSAGLSAPTAAGATLSLACPEPAGLMAAGRAVTAAATDVNGAAVAVDVPVRARNRLPEVRPRGGAGVTTLELHHTVGPCPSRSGTCFLVSGDDPFVATDPDGDPIGAVTLVPRVEAGRAASSAAALTGAGGSSFQFGTALAFPAEFRSAAGLSGFSLSATASDPFGTSAPAQPALAIRILNRPPEATLAPTAVSAGHRYDAALGAYLAAADLVAFTDPDGDPLVIDGLADDPDCGALTLAGGVVSASCRRDFALTPTATPSLAGFSGAHSLLPGVRDGWETTRHATTLVVENQPPSVPNHTGPVEACTCACPSLEPYDPWECPVPSRWTAESATFAVPLRPVDADGDPLRVTFRMAQGSPAGSLVNPAAATALPEACQATITSTAPVVSGAVEVTVSDGVSSAAGTWIVSSVTCATEGTICAPAGGRVR